jgi:hypothetical protein
MDHGLRYKPDADIMDRLEALPGYGRRRARNRSGLIGAVVCAIGVGALLIWL